MSSGETEQAILDLLAERGEGKSVCPGEVARRIDSEEWRDWMDGVRDAARALAEEKRIEICQGGDPVDPDDFHGPIRLRLPEQEG